MRFNQLQLLTSGAASHEIEALPLNCAVLHERWAAFELPACLKTWHDMRIKQYHYREAGRMLSGSKISRPMRKNPALTAIAVR